MSYNAKKDIVRRFVKFVIANDEDFEGRRDTSPEEWFMLVESMGVTPDFSDDNFTIWFVGKCRQEFPSSEEVRNIAKKFFSLKILNPIENAVHRGLLDQLIVDNVLGDREWCKLVGDYCITNFRETEVGEKALQLAKSFGITSLSYKEIYGVDLGELFSRTKEAYKNSTLST